MPGAWEIVKERQERALIAVITLADMRFAKPWVQMIRNLQVPPGSMLVWSEGLPFHAARNHAVKLALDNGFGWLFFLDSDTIPPTDIISRLRATGRDLVAGLYFRRHPPFAPAHGTAVQQPDGQIGTGPLPNHVPGDIVPVDFLAAGATLISRGCLEHVMQAFPRPFDWGVDIAPVPDGHGGNLPGWSEDYIFSWRARGLGFQPCVATGVVCQHEVVGVVSHKGIEVVV